MSAVATALAPFTRSSLSDAPPSTSPLHALSDICWNAPLRSKLVRRVNLANAGDSTSTPATPSWLPVRDTEAMTSHTPHTHTLGIACHSSHAQRTLKLVRLDISFNAGTRALAPSTRSALPDHAIQTLPRHTLGLSCRAHRRGSNSSGESLLSTLVPARLLPPRAAHCLSHHQPRTTDFTTPHHATTHALLSNARPRFRCLVRAILLNGGTSACAAPAPSPFSVPETPTSSRPPPHGLFDTGHANLQRPSSSGRALLPTLEPGPLHLPYP